MERKTSLFLLILSIVLFLRLFYFYSTKPKYREGDSISFTTTLSQEPKLYSSYQSFSLQSPKGDLILVKATPDIEYHYGDELNISGNLTYRLLGNNKVLSLNFPQILLVKNKTAPLAVMLFIRQRIITSFKETLPPDSASLLLGIVFGIKQDMSQKFLSNIKTTGVMHVIAASGMNVTLVGGFIFYLFLLFFKRQVAIVLTILGILFYAFLAGFQASIVRASIMGIIAFSSQGLGKQNQSFYALLLTGFLMLFAFPKFLLDIGFQLSFLSTLGILFIPKLFKIGKNAFFQDFLTTISAQAATFPIILGSFGTYSIWSVIVNVLVLWTVPVLMILGGVASIFIFFLEPFAKVFLYLCLPLLAYFEDIVSFFGGFGQSLNFSSLSWQFTLSYYLILSSIIVFVFKKKSGS